LGATTITETNTFHPPADQTQPAPPEKKHYTQAELSAMGDGMRKRRKRLSLTLADIAAATGLAKSTVHRYERGGIKNPPQATLRAIAAAIYMPLWELTSATQPPGASGGCVAEPRYNPRQIPIVDLASVGKPFFDTDDIISHTYTDLAQTKEYFAVKVADDSLDQRRICRGDIVTVRRQQQVVNGAIALIQVEGETALIRQFFLSGRIITLIPHSSNPCYQPLIYHAAQHKIQILGQIVENKFQL